MRRRNCRRQHILFLSVICWAASARAESAFNSVSIGLKGSSAQETSEKSYDWGPTVSAEIVTSDKASRNRLKYEIEYDYDDSFSRLNAGGTEQSARVRTSEFKYGKLSVLQLFGYDLKEKMRFVPYVSGGVQYVDSRADTDGESRNDFYWAPTWGVGVEFSLGKKTTLALDYDANTLHGDRRIAHLSMELKFAVMGDPDE
jgi:opacity protein-like surface antigen